MRYDAQTLSNDSNYVGEHISHTLTLHRLNKANFHHSHSLHDNDYFGPTVEGKLDQ
jgi:hypothetical protein